MVVPGLVVTALALGLLAFVARAGYGVAPRAFAALGMALGLVTIVTPDAAAAFAAALLLVILGAITASVDRKRIRSQSDARTDA